MEVDQVKQIKRILEKMKEQAKTDEDGQWAGLVEELIESFQAFGGALNEEVGLWEKEREVLSESRKEKIKEFIEVAKEFKN